MGRAGRACPRMLCCVLLVSLILLFGSVATAMAAESISISCHKGNDNIGNVVVYDVRAAASTCDMFFKDCQGECYGCFYDFDYVEDVCIDWRGRMFLR